MSHAVAADRRADIRLTPEALATSLHGFGLTCLSLLDDITLRPHNSRAHGANADTFRIGASYGMELRE